MTVVAPKLSQQQQQKPAAPRPGPMRARFAFGAQPLLALTHDEQLLATLKKVSDSGHEVWPAGSEVDLGNALMTNDAGVVLIDCAATATPIATLTQRLHAQFPELVLIVTGGAGEQAGLAAQIADGSVHRFLHKPASEQRVRLFVDAAWRRHAATRALPQLGRAAAQRWPGGGGKWWLGLVVLAAVAAPLLWIGIRTSQGPANAGASATSTVAPGDTADERALDALLTDAETRLQAHDLEGAQQLVDRARVLNPTHPRVVFLNAQINAQRQHAAAHAQRAAPGAAAPAEVPSAPPVLAAPGEAAEPAQAAATGASALPAAAPGPASGNDGADALARLTLAFNMSLEQGHIVTPADDSAKFYLAQLLQQDAGSAATDTARSAYRARVLAEAHGALQQQDLAATRRWLAEGRAAGADAAELSTLEATLAAGEQQVRQAQAAQQAQPAQPAEPTPSVVSESSLTRTRYVPPQFPDNARQRGIGGWVELQFLVGTDGKVSDVAIVGAEPAGIFEQAALEAVHNWRYQPVVRDGQTVSQRARVRLRFALLR